MVVIPSFTRLTVLQAHSCVLLSCLHLSKTGFGILGQSHCIQPPKLKNKSDQISYANNQSASPIFAPPKVRQKCFLPLLFSHLPLCFFNDMPDSLLHQIALTLVPQVGAVTAKTLVSYCGSAEAVFQAKRRELLKIPGVGPVLADGLQLAEPLRQAERELVFLEKNEVTALFYTHERYPVRLRQCHDSPAILFFKGSSVDLLNADRIVAIVGTRQPTDYGKALCEEIVEGLNPYNVLIVSGLAYGVDITAHKKATALDVANIGVLGQGLASIYPAQHRPTL